MPLTKVDLRLKYKLETGFYPVPMADTSIHNRYGHYDYTEWVEDLAVEALQKLENDRQLHPGSDQERDQDGT